jgi:hypothetical protein
MSELLRGSGNELVPSSMRRSVTRVARSAVEEELAEGLVGVAKVEAAYWVAAAGMNRTAMLTELEKRTAGSDPVAADRVVGFADDFALVARQALRRMALRS